VNARIRRRCGALGFLASALLHLALVLVWIGLAARPEMPSTTLAERAVPIDLAMFADPEAMPSSPAQIPTNAIPEAPESVPGPPPLEPEPDQRPDLKPSPRIEPQTSPRAISEPKPRAKPKTEAQTLSSKARPKAVSPRTETTQAAPEIALLGMAHPGPAPLPASSAPVAAPAIPPPDLAELRSGYLAALRSAIAANKYYPDSARRRQEEGTVLIAFVLEADGLIHQVRIDTGSGFAAIDAAAVAAVERLGRFQPIPRELQRARWELKVPISFAILDNRR